MNLDDHGVRCDGQRSLADPSEGKAQAAQEVRAVRAVQTVREERAAQAARA